MGHHGPDKPRVDAKERRATGAVQEVEQNLSLMDQSKGKKGEAGRPHWQRQLGEWGQWWRGWQPRADAQSRMCLSFTPVQSGLRPCL